MHNTAHPKLQFQILDKNFLCFNQTFLIKVIFLNKWVHKNLPYWTFRWGISTAGRRHNACNFWDPLLLGCVGVEGAGVVSNDSLLPTAAKNSSNLTRFGPLRIRYRRCLLCVGVLTQGLQSELSTYDKDFPFWQNDTNTVWKLSKNVSTLRVQWEKISWNRGK